MTTDFRAARLNMVESQVRTNDVTDHAVQDAMRVVARENFCGSRTHLAYADADVEYAPGRYLLKPRDVAKLLQALRPKAGERALAICAPYAAEVLRQIGLSVDESDGAAQPASGYDVAICEAAVAETPTDWIEALGPGGRLAVIERQGPVGQGKIYLRGQSDVGALALFDATAPYLPGHEPRKSFAF
ncbi:MAG TPA: protein-L-isoaspartate O-methyltransferase [Caulobacteraceae bacterium]|nr:protein-L-isoaspartate O-methyltransferase [Caulobacteraceae bacterium]